ncbi:hypothetical protein CMV_029920 [Castanea mollissima]|uniref:C-JID domain-containing protein n=1 Tax=Castanea mollissima TaxID=60419 RepID=A0A8J4Q5X8_9ROSI|nr:hypothetical protein CMV_029920 [Castanea mollissima]
MFSQFGALWQPRQNPSDLNDYGLVLPGSEIPKWFNHQSDGNSISFWVGRDCDYHKFVYCVVLGLNQRIIKVSLKFNGINSTYYWFPLGITSFLDLTCNHVYFFILPSWLGHLNLLERNRVEVKFECDFYYFGGDSHILRCGVHAECICPLVQHLSTNALPPTSIPAFPICSISNTVTPSPHLLNSCLELSHSNSTETTYNDFDSPLEGSHDDGCDSSLSLCTSPMGRNYLPPQPQVTCHISLPKLRLGLPGLGIGSNFSEGFHWGSSPLASNFVSDDDFNWYSPSNSDDDSDFNLYSPSTKRRKS